ncbi:MAG: molybdenum cofactor guanylyltransferase [Undibacterium sp.]|nr:molybdenum cofactor guanylyltransferase [Opitutaceae bacterium]
MADVRPFSALLLAAGRSRRMGSDKALLTTADGRTWWEQQCAVLTQAGAAEIFISARPEQTWVPATMTVVRDAEEGGGPLAGIVAALERAAHGHVAVLAVDLPAMRAEWFARLLAQCAPGVGAVGKNGNNFEPLAAIYPREILPAARGALARGEGSLQRLIAAEAARFAVREIGAAEAWWFENRNERV